jgi:hypothetical protein
MFPLTLQFFISVSPLNVPIHYIRFTVALHPWIDNGQTPLDILVGYEHVYIMHVAYPFILLWKSVFLYSKNRIQAHKEWRIKMYSQNITNQNACQ